jgi:hypothetical protein
VPHVKYAMDYRLQNSFSMSYGTGEVIFAGDVDTANGCFTFAAGIDQHW